jgi:hypothetical protein
MPPPMKGPTRGIRFVKPAMAPITSQNFNPMIAKPSDDKMPTISATNN